MCKVFDIPGPVKRSQGHERGLVPLLTMALTAMCPLASLITSLSFHFFIVSTYPTCLQALLWRLDDMADGNKISQHWARICYWTRVKIWSVWWMNEWMNEWMDGWMNECFEQAYRLAWVTNGSLQEIFWSFSGSLQASVLGYVPGSCPLSSFASDFLVSLWDCFSKHFLISVGR